MKKVFAFAAGIVGLVAIIALLDALFTVDETEQAIVFQFGDPKRVIVEPGLNVKVPFLQDVVYYESRLLANDPEPEEIILADQKRLVVDTFTRFRIEDSLLFFQAVRTEFNASSRLADIVNSAVRRVLGSVTLTELLSRERVQIMEDITRQVRAEASELGIGIADVRIRRADLPVETSQAIYDRMRSEREREAREFRAQGGELSAQIRSRADRETTVILAEAEKQSQIVRGDGDQQAARIYAAAHDGFREFYDFQRSLEAYRNALADGETTLVLSPDSEFFRYFTTVPQR